MKEKVVDFINKLAEDKGIKISEDTDLFVEGVLDSMGILAFLAYLDQEVKVELSLQDLQEEYFQSINSIVNWVLQLKGKDRNE